MTASCHALPADARQDFLALATRAICIRPGETPAQGAERTRHLVHMAMGLEPRDGLEYMLAILLAGHFHLILDSMSEVFQGQTDAARARSKSNIVALDRMTIGLLREMRREQKRPLAEAQPVKAQPAKASVAEAAHKPPPLPAAPPPAAPVPGARPQPPLSRSEPLANPLLDIGGRRGHPLAARGSALASTSLASGISVSPPPGLVPFSMPSSRLADAAVT